MYCCVYILVYAYMCVFMYALPCLIAGEPVTVVGAGSPSFNGVYDVCSNMDSRCPVSFCKRSSSTFERICLWYASEQERSSGAKPRGWCLTKDSRLTPQWSDCVCMYWVAWKDDFSKVRPPNTQDWYSTICSGGRPSGAQPAPRVISGAVKHVDSGM